MGEMFENQTIGVTCPKCGNQIEQTIGWLKSNDNVTCPGCCSDFIINSEKFFAGIEKAEEAIAKFGKSIRDRG
ncbi:YnfU family zinc-binding protein [Brucella sp. MAB-22]|uniref:YnfU family zinc-binding protein n=1 Tax=Brucella sp. MAB-22 TaxID=2986424 RepID=UPI0029CA5C4E|nr:YnfU family zinc-binding protein [Brucella sp. MAB-22]